MKTNQNEQTSQLTLLLNSEGKPETDSNGVSYTAYRTPFGYLMKQYMDFSLILFPSGKVQVRNLADEVVDVWKHTSKYFTHQGSRYPRTTKLDRIAAIYLNTDMSDY